MPDSVPCPHCTNDIPQSAERCPHCAEPGYFWNVISASDSAERTALQTRYDDAKADAVSRNADVGVQDFELALDHSAAVLARSESEVLRLATSTRQLYTTYYKQIEAGLRLPDGDDWDLVRQLADTVLFPAYRENIRFAALSLDGVGLPNYGSCSLMLRSNMISRRASVFQENSVLFMEHHGISLSNPDLPKGFRATWNDRAKLCVAKLAGNIDSTTKPIQYSRLLVKAGATSADDEFVEVHIWGPISVLTMERVSVIEPKTRRKATIVKAIKSKLAKHGVTVS